MNLFRNIFFQLLVLVGMTCLQTHTMHAMKIKKNSEQSTLQSKIINPYTITGTTAGALFAVAAIFLLCETGWANKILASDMCKNIDKESSWFKYLIAQWAAIETKCSFANSTTKWRNAFIKIVIILAVATAGGTAGYAIKDIKAQLEKAHAAKETPKKIEYIKIFTRTDALKQIDAIEKALNVYLEKFKEKKMTSFLKEEETKKILFKFLSEIKTFLNNEKNPPKFIASLEITPYGILEKKNSPGFLDNTSNGKGWSSGSTTKTTIMDIEEDLRGRGGTIKFTNQAPKPTLSYIREKIVSESRETLTIVFKNASLDSIHKIKLNIENKTHDVTEYTDEVDDTNKITSKKSHPTVVYNNAVKHPKIRCFDFNQEKKSYELSTSFWEKIYKMIF